MKTRHGQVALYLALVMVAICLLAMTSVGAFLAVRAKNRMMNAGDAAALAVAKHQGALLNRIGQINLGHLGALLSCRRIEGEPPEVTSRRINECREACRALALDQARICLLDPLGGITEGNRAAQENGAPQSDDMMEILRQHVIDVRTFYVANPEAYPEPYEGAWEEYAQRLEMEIGGGIWAGPDNIEFLDAVGGHRLLDAQFYNAIAGRNWCWFHFNARGLLDAYSGFGDWGPLPSADDELDDELRRRRCANGEVYSLHLQPKVGNVIFLLGRDLIKSVTGCTDEDIDESLMIADPEQTWYFYDDWYWRTWWEIDPDGEWRFPVVGKVKPEYDVLGCAAICRVIGSFADVVFGEGGERSLSWFAAAKPFGTVENLEGEVDVVTALKSFVVPSFTDTRLVPVDAVGGRNLSTANPDWMRHIRNHLSRYLENGPGVLGSCWYCEQLRRWENASLRAEAREWLRYNAGTCRRWTGPGTSSGGSAHGH